MVLLNKLLPKLRAEGHKVRRLLSCAVVFKVTVIAHPPHVLG